MPKMCKCGLLKTDGDPQHCKVCNTFTHPVYVRKAEGRKE